MNTNHHNSTYEGENGKYKRTKYLVLGAFLLNRVWVPRVDSNKVSLEIFSFFSFGEFYLATPPRKITFVCNIKVDISVFVYVDFRLFFFLSVHFPY